MFITISVNLVGKYIEDTKEQYWAAVKLNVKYLKGIINFGLIISSRKKLMLKGDSSDANHAGNLDTRRSTSGSAFLLGSGSIAWSSRHRQLLALAQLNHSRSFKSRSTRISLIKIVFR